MVGKRWTFSTEYEAEARGWWTTLATVVARVRGNSG